MPPSLVAAEILEREFLTTRSRLIDLAAALDRLDQANGSVADDPRMAQIRRSLEILADDTTDRAEQLQQLFSLPYREDWREEYGL
jgi:hypothetical protein